MSELLSRLSSLAGQQKINNNSKEITRFLSSIVEKQDLLKKATKYQILDFVKIIWKHKGGTADEIKELKNGYFASFGTDNKLVLYDSHFNFKILGEDLGDWIHHILEITSLEKIEKDIQIIICTDKSLFLNQINIEKNTSRIQRYEYGGVVCLELKKNNYVICGDDGADHFSDLFSKIIQSKKNKLFNEFYRGGMVLNQNLVVFSSNKALLGGEDHLKFYNPNSKKIAKEIINYSFILSSNGLALLESDNKYQYKIFIAACKQYLEGQKNGILSVISLFGENDSLIEKFYPTENFEVYCFCPISIIQKDINEKRILENEKNKKIKTNYFLVGGFDQNIRRGIIKLYKANFDENPENTYITYIQDIEIDNVYKDNTYISEIINKKEDLALNNEEKNQGDLQKQKMLFDYKVKTLKERINFNGFGGPITSLIQSSLYGNILATCYDGNVYLLTPPNLEYYEIINKNNE